MSNPEKNPKTLADLDNSYFEELEEAAGGSCIPQRIKDHREGGRSFVMVITSLSYKKGQGPLAGKVPFPYEMELLQHFDNGEERTRTYRIVEPQD